MLDRLVAPEYQTIDSINIIEPQTYYLSNDIPVHVISAGKQPVINFEILIPAGKSREEKDGVQYFTTKMLTEGTRSHSATEISHIIDKYGAHLNLNPGFDFIGIECLGLKKYFQPLLALIYELLTEAEFPQKELHNFKNIQRQNIRLNNEKNNIRATKEFRKVLFGTDYPYGKTLEEEVISEINREDLGEFFNNNFRDFEILISGKVDQEDVNFIDQYFGNNLFGPPEEYKILQLPPNSGNNYLNPHVIEKASSVQSSVRVGRIMTHKSHLDYLYLKVVITILGGYFGSRLMSNLREEKGYTYGVSASLVDLLNTSYLIIGTDVKKSFTGQTLDEISFEMDRLKREYVAENELEMVRNYMAGSLLASLDTPFAQAERFKEVYLFGLDTQFYNKFLHTINTISPDTIMEMARKYFTDLSHVVVGGME